MKAYVLAGVILAAVMAHPAAAMTVGNCPDAMEEKAETAVDHIKTWPQLLDWYRNYLPCDNGAPAEGVSDDVAKLLAYHWGGLGRTRTALLTDPDFAGFVLGHIDATWDDKEFMPAMFNVGTKCPSDLTAFCANALVAIKAAKAESEQVITKP